MTGAKKPWHHEISNLVTEVGDRLQNATEWWCGGKAKCPKETCSVKIIISGLTAIGLYFRQNLLAGSERKQQRQDRTSSTIRNHDELWPYQTAGSYAPERLSFSEQWTFPQWINN